jgi:hypothetical protein
MSHFSFTRNSADACALDHKNKESAGPFEYATDSQVRSESCSIGLSPFMHNHLYSVPSRAIDIESDLRGQSYNLSKCAKHKFTPDNAMNPTHIIKSCIDNQLVPEYTRINKPCNLFSGISINRFHPLCDDLQNISKIHNNSYIGLNTRLQAKDTFKETQKKPSYN